MGCCTGCDTGTGCETGCSPCAGGACPIPIPQPAQFFIPNFAPATGCADGSCKLPGGVPVGTGALPFMARPFFGAPAAAVYQPPPAIVPRPSPQRFVDASRLSGFWAIVNVTTGEVGMNLRAAPSTRAALLGQAPNGTRVFVRQTDIPEIDTPPGSPMRWWAVAIYAYPVGIDWNRQGYMRAVGPAGESNLTRVM